MIEPDENTMSYVKRLRKNLGLDKCGRFSRMVHFLVSFQSGALNIFDVILIGAIVGSGIGCLIYRAFLAISNGS